MNQGAAYSVAGGDELFERGSFAPKIVVGWKPLTAAQHKRLGKDCDQCGFYRHGSCMQGAKAVEKAASDSCEKFNWKGVAA